MVAEKKFYVFGARGNGFGDIDCNILPKPYATLKNACKAIRKDIIATFEGETVNIPSVDEILQAFHQYDVLDVCKFVIDTETSGACYDFVWKIKFM